MGEGLYNVACRLCPPFCQNTTISPVNNNPYEHVTQEDLEQIIVKHGMFMNGRPGGARALLKFKDLSGLNFKGGDLSGADFTASILRGANMSGGTFNNAVFYGCDMQQASLERAIFRRADFRGAYIAGANLSHSDLSSADMREGKVLEKGKGGMIVERDAPEGHLNPKTVFTGARLTQTNLSGIRAMATDFSDADLSGVTIRGADLRSANFKGANLSQSDLSGSDLRNSNMQDAVMTGTILEQAEVAGIDDTGAIKSTETMGEHFDHEEQDLAALIREHGTWIKSIGKEGKQLDLSGYDLRQIPNLKQYPLTALIARKASFLGQDMSGMHLQSAILDGSDFRDCNLARADLRAASLMGVNLTRVDLTGANCSPLHFGKPGEPGHRLRAVSLRKSQLRYADLTAINLADADLSGADLSYANLTHADLRRADLSEANLDHAKLDGAVLEGAKMPVK